MSFYSSVEKLPIMFKVEFKVDLARNILTKYDKDGESMYSLQLISKKTNTLSYDVNLNSIRFKFANE